MLDDALLSDEPRLLAADHDGVLRAVATAGAHVARTWAPATPGCPTSSPACARAR